MERLIVHRDGRVTRAVVGVKSRTVRGTIGWVRKHADGVWAVQRVGERPFPRTFTTRRDALRVFTAASGSIADALLRAPQ